jgi:hypothetical protein
MSLFSTFPVSVKNVTDWASVPGSNTYFRSSQVTPHISRDGELVVYNAKGDRRSWGTPSVRSDVSKLTDDVIKVEVTGWHKHTISPVGGIYYFVREGSKWVRRTAAHKAVKAALAK